MMMAGRVVAAEPPNVILIMTDDQGWGQTGYYKHPVLKTPNLDAMARNGLRLDRFYAGSPVCSPTRATVLTGRTNDRTGVISHGYALRLQERTLSVAMKKAGYATGHFGKWHLNGFYGPGAPILSGDRHGPGAFGFEHWVSVTNFFDLDPLMSVNGEIKQFKGNTSEIIVGEAMKFIDQCRSNGKPFFTVIWDGSPHSPWQAEDQDVQDKAFTGLDEKSRQHYGELVAFDRSVGELRKGLRDRKLADNTLIWYCSDNGGLSKVRPSANGGLRGHKGTIYEGGLRVPAIIEWPAKLKPRVSSFPASTLDIFPTLMDLLNLKSDAIHSVHDGMSLKGLLDADIEVREKAIPFRYKKGFSLIDNQYKLINHDLKKGKFELYDLNKDPAESENLVKKLPKIFNRMKSEMHKWNQSIQTSYAGQDYPEGKVDPKHPSRRNWYEHKSYEPYYEEWKDRPEFSQYYKRIKKKKNQFKK